MSISCPLEDSTASSSALVLVPVPQRTLSPRRLEANRRNAQRSTGPRTARGKARVSRNALKHGLCAAHAHLPEECDATFNLHVAEIEAELQPRTVLQRILCTQIANLLWQIRKLPEAQAKLFSHERRKAMPDGEHPGTDEEPSIPPCEVLARRFSDAPTCNGFLLLERYERGMHSRLMRLMREYERLKKDHPTTPYHENEIQEFKEDHQRRQQERREQQRREVEQWKQTQAKPAENAPGASGGPIRDDLHDAPMTEQTQRALENEPPIPTPPARPRHFSGGVEPQNPTATEVAVPRGAVECRTNVSPVSDELGTGQTAVLPSGVLALNDPARNNQPFASGAGVPPGAMGIRNGGAAWASAVSQLHTGHA